MTAADRHSPSSRQSPAVPVTRLTIVQYGDYAEAVGRFAAGGEENYYAQRYTVEFLGQLSASPEIERITVISFATDYPEAALHNGVHCQGIELYPRDRAPRFDALLDAVSASRPTHLVVAAPFVPVIRWALGHNVRVLPLFADSFRGSGIRKRFRNWRLARLLNSRAIEFVANHNLAASLDLARIGVQRHKILPFDWPELVSVRDYPPKTAPSSDRPFRMVYVGQLMQAKGVADTINALAALHRRGRNAALTLIGAGNTEVFSELARQKGVADHVTLAGLLPHQEVLAQMRAHDAVLVPSHHAYPEGLPMTLYEALCVRTPLVVSDHPMFALRIRDGAQALVHPERDPEALADRIEMLASNPALYEQFSLRAEDSARNYLCPLKWDQLLASFLDPARREDLHRFSLARHAYL